MALPSQDSKPVTFSQSVSCPLLGVAGAPLKRYLTPDMRNHCFAVEPAQPVLIAQQARVCLGGDFTACSYYMMYQEYMISETKKSAQVDEYVPQMDGNVKEEREDIKPEAIPALVDFTPSKGSTHANQQTASDTQPVPLSGNGLEIGAEKVGIQQASASENPALLKAAYQVMISGDKPRARKVLQEAVRQNPNDYRAWLWLAGVSNSPRSSLAYISRAEALKPGDPAIAKARAWAESLLTQPAIAPPNAAIFPAIAIPAEAARFPWQDVIWTSLATLLLIALVTTGERFRAFAPVRVVVGFLYVLFAPGYWLTNILFPLAADLDMIERVGLSLGLSIALAPVLALILNWSPSGLRLMPILIGEAVLTGLLMAIAIWRRSRLPVEQLYAPAVRWKPVAWWRELPGSDRKVYLIASQALLVAAIAVIWVFFIPTADQYNTAFYALGENGLAEDYPREAVVGLPLRLTLGIGNQERQEHSYRIEVLADEQLVQSIGPFVVPAGEKLQTPVVFALPESGANVPVHIYLYRAEDSQPYRSLELWLKVLPAE